jgi:gas vesicle protein
MPLAAVAATSSSPAWLPVAGVVAGAVVSGTVAVILAFVQRKSLNDQTAAQAEQTRRNRRQDTRQEKYADYLQAAEAVVESTAPLSEMFTAWSRKLDGVSDAERDRLGALLAQFQQCRGDAVRHAQLVRLAGPSGIAPPVDKALRAMRSLRDAAEEGVTAVLANVEPTEADWFDGLTELRAAIEEFIAQASAILDGERT